MLTPRYDHSLTYLILFRLYNLIFCMLGENLHCLVRASKPAAVWNCLWESLERLLPLFFSCYFYPVCMGQLRCTITVELCVAAVSATSTTSCLRVGMDVMGCSRINFWAALDMQKYCTALLLHVLFGDWSSNCLTVASAGAWLSTALLLHYLPIPFPYSSSSTPPFPLIARPQFPAVTAN